MSRKHLAAVAIAIAVLTDPAAAELRGSPEGPPVFTAAETAIIARNTLLAKLVQDNPWAVRRLLDALTADASAAGNSNPAAASGNSKSEARSPLDGAANPDLDELQRTSPEALLDLFQILKQAQPQKPATPPKRN